MTVNRDGTALLSALAPEATFLLLSSLAAREPQLSPYAASKRAAEEVVAGRSGPWLTVRAPAVYGPGDRETLAYFKAVARGLAPRPKVADARLSLIHVADLAEALALALDQPPPPSTYEIDDGTRRRLLLSRHGRRRRPRARPPAAVARRAARGHGGRGRGSMRSATRSAVPCRSSRRARSAKFFISDWTAHDRRLAAALGFRPRFDLATGFAETILWYRRQGWL